MGDVDSGIATKPTRKCGQEPVQGMPHGDSGPGVRSTEQRYRHCCNQLVDTKSMQCQAITIASLLTKDT